MRINMVFGSPGTGKTTYLLTILEKLLKKYAPEEIAFVSFTKKGAYEGKERALQKFGFTEEQTPYFRTLHSIAFRELQLKTSNIIDKADYKEFSHIMGMKFIGYYTEDLKHNDDSYLFFDQLYRNNKAMANYMLHFLDSQKLQLVRNNYKRFKKHNNILDFTDIVELFILKEIKLPVKVAIIDEAQDLTSLQWRMIFTAFRGCKELYLAGDDDQAIFEWSGADVNFFLNIKHHDCTILDHSYRLPSNILNFSKQISKRIKKRVQKEFTGRKEEGTIKYINRLEDLQIDNQKSWMFLSRNNYYLTEIKNYFQNKGMIYNYKNNMSVKLTELEAIKQWQLVKGIKTHHLTKIVLPTVLRIHLKPDYDLRQNWYEVFKWKEDKIKYFRDLVKNDIFKQSELQTNININTIHTVKGGEADNVVILQDITKTIKNNLEKNPDSEHRIFYVAATRTKQNLYIMQNKSKHFYDFRG